MSQGFIYKQYSSGSGSGSVISVNGFFGVVSLTANNIPETASRFYVNANIRDALFGANSPSAGNVFATMADIAGVEYQSNKGIAGGYVPLNMLGKIDNSYLNLSVLQYVSSWDAFTNTPALADGGAFTVGDAYIVGIAGTQDLGSGPITFAIGDLVIYNSSLVWEKIIGVAPGVSSVNGFSGAVVLDADDISETATRYYQTAWQKQSADAAEAAQASPTDRYALVSELSIIVGSTFLMPENFSDGQTLGDGTFRLLNSLGYTNVTAAAAWPRVNSTYGMNVLTYDIDWVSWQEMELFKRDTGATAVTCVGGKGYCPGRSIEMAKDMTSASFYKRSFIYVYNLNGSAFANLTGTNFPMFDRYPADQTEANGLRLVYRSVFREGYWYGNGSNNSSDCAIRMWGSESVVENCGFTGFGIPLKMEFCLEPRLTSLKIENYGLYGIYLGDGLWSGAAPNIAQSNNCHLTQLHFVNGAGKTPTAGLYVNGNRNIYGNVFTFEGFNGSTYHIYYNDNGATTVKNILDLHNLDFEAAGASRAAIKMYSGSGQIGLDRFNNQVNNIDMPVLLEVEYGANPIGVKVTNADYNTMTGWKFRNIMGAGYGGTWVVEDVSLNDNSSLLAAANWAVDLGGSIPAAIWTRYLPVLN